MTGSQGVPPGVLGAIVAAALRRVEVASADDPPGVLERRAFTRSPRGRLFRERLTGPGWNVIAECKRRSPSGGILAHGYDPVRIARAYEAEGAAAISVLTEPAFFDGSLEHLAAVREAVGVPLLRKDFIVDRYQVLEARAAGADAVLLIVAALDDRALVGLLRDADALGLAALVEAHDAGEVARAVDAGAGIIGVNNRDLRSLEVHVDRAAALADGIPGDVVAVAESGLRTGAQLAALRAAGFDAFLVGETLMRSGRASLVELREAASRASAMLSAAPHTRASGIDA